jgi:general control protein GCN4
LCPRANPSPTTKIQQQQSTINPSSSKSSSETLKSSNASCNNATTTSSKVATITLYDFQSVKTDYQQQWLLQPQPTTASASSTTSQNHQDFYLYTAPQPGPAYNQQPLTSQQQARRLTAPSLPSNNLLDFDGSLPLFNNNTSTTTTTTTTNPSVKLQNLHQQFKSATEDEVNNFNHWYNNQQQQLRRQNRNTIQQKRPRPPVPLFHSNTTGHDFSMTDSMSIVENHLIKPRLTSTSVSPFETPMGDFSAELDFSNLDIPEMTTDSLTFTAANDPTSATATISPQDLFLSNHDFGAAPDTTTTGYLSTPSLYDGTPDMSSYDCSPAFGTMDVEPNWPPLFADNTDKDDFASAPLFASTGSLDSIELNNNDLSLVSSTSSVQSRSTPRISATPAADDMLRKTLGPTSVLKSSRRQTRDLAPIAVNEEDDLAVKRARNTMAARKSRQKKRDIEDALREALEKMTRERDRWRMLAVKHGAEIELD